MSIADDYKRWAEIHNDAMADVVAALDDDATTPEQLDDVARQADERLREIPPRVRAMEACMATATRLVELLAGRGVRFANPDNAPAQIAGSMYAVWLWHDHNGVVDPTDWLALPEACTAAVAWAMDEPDDAHPLAVRLVADVCGDDFPADELREAVS